MSRCSAQDEAPSFHAGRTRPVPPKPGTRLNSGAGTHCTRLAEVNENGCYMRQKLIIINTTAARIRTNSKPETMFRKTLFWIHLASGVTAGLVILMMSVTGVLLTYERQMLEWANRDLHAEPAPEASRQPLGKLIAAVELKEPGFEATSITMSSNPTAPVEIGAGRGAGSRYVNAYSGQVLGRGAAGLQEFFDAMTGWHRWFNVSGDGRAPWRAITGASNLLFLFLIVSGMYLWLPRVYKWAAFKGRLLFNAKAVSGHARDFNWHHVIGIWTSVPLAVVVATAVVFSYPWASDLVYRVFGEEPPARGRGGPPVERQFGEGGTPVEMAMSLDGLLAVAAAQLDDWRAITVQLPSEGDSTVEFSIDRGTGGQPQHRHTLTLDAYSGKVASWQPFESQTPGRRARSWVRFLHTGEALGVWGQTVAGLVSLTSVIMVWTGLALAYRRLIAPLLKRAPGRR